MYELQVLIYILYVYFAHDKSLKISFEPSVQFQPKVAVYER